MENIFIIFVNVFNTIIFKYKITWKIYLYFLVYLILFTIHHIPPRKIFPCYALQELHIAVASRQSREGFIPCAAPQSIFLANLRGCPSVQI